MNSFEFAVVGTSDTKGHMKWAYPRTIGPSELEGDLKVPQGKLDPKQTFTG